MKKIFYIYASIPESIYNKKVKYLISNTHDFRWKHEKMYGLYAWTTSKKIVKEFFEIRKNDIFTMIKSDDYDDSELERLEDRYSDLKLECRRYYFDAKEDEKNSILIVSTKNEYVNSTMNSEEYLYEFGPKPSEEFPYHIFKKKIIKALDTLGYTSKYDIEYGTEAEAESAQWNLTGFNLTKYGQNYKIHFDNQMNILLYLYRYFFYGNEKFLKEN